MTRSLLVVAVMACHAPAPAGIAEASDDDPEDPTDTLPTVAGASATQAPRVALLTEAQRELAAVTESHYAHHTHVDEPTGVFDFDCSGFVDYALARVAPDALQPILDATRRRPLAKHFEAFFAAPRAPWTSVEHTADLVPGDVIAWLEPPAKHSRNTGHVMIVEQAPEPGKRTGELVVGVIDSSHSGHGAADARVRDHRNGLGSGRLVLLTDGSGRAIGYRWSLSRRSVAYRTEIALGHLP